VQKLSGETDEEKEQYTLSSQSRGGIRLLLCASVEAYSVTLQNGCVQRPCLPRLPQLPEAVVMGVLCQGCLKKMPALTQGRLAFSFGTTVQASSFSHWGYRSAWSPRV